MHQRHKLREARYFLERMRAESENPTHFAFELSAYLGAARSVLQYILEEVRPKPAGQAWYDSTIASDPLLRYLKDKRDENIHSIPAKPTISRRTEPRTHLDLGDDMIVPYDHVTTITLHYFDDWKRDENVLELADRYLELLEGINNTGIQSGLLLESAA